VAAVGVRLGEAPDAPSRGEVHVRIPPSQHSSSCQNSFSERSCSWRVALGETYPSGDVESLHAPGTSSWPRWFAPAAISRMPINTGMAECVTTRPMNQDGRDSGSRVTDMKARSRIGDPASWKDPL
jgi:hypothetical protein